MHKSLPRKQAFVSKCSICIRISIGFFIFVNLVIFYNIYDNQNPECLRVGTCRINTKPRILPREKWGQTIYFNVLLGHFTRVGDEWRLLPSSNSESLKHSEDLNCTALRKLDKVRFVGAGYTKSTYKVNFGNQTFALKTVNIDGHDMNSCLAQEDRYLFDCFLITAAKILKEISILRSLSHDNVVKILGYCVPADPDLSDPRHTVAIFQEYGEPVEVIKLLQLPWEDRLRISLGLSRLLKHLSSFEEPVALNDFRRQQFVVANGELKLVDADDVGLRERRCDDGACCSAPLYPNASVCVPCGADRVCRGYNEKLNVVRTGKHFIQHILPHGAPVPLGAVAGKIAASFLVASLDARAIWREMEDLAERFRTGSYRNVSDIKYLSGYKAYNKKDASTRFDYRCQLTVSGYGCVTSVVDAEEAAELCWADPKCKAFVMTDITTWTGRRIVKFKNGFGNLLRNNSTTLFLKL